VVPDLWVTEGKNRGGRVDAHQPLHWHHCSLYSRLWGVGSIVMKELFWQTVYFLLAILIKVLTNEHSEPLWRDVLSVGLQDENLIELVPAEQKRETLVRLTRSFFTHFLQKRAQSNKVSMCIDLQHNIHCAICGLAEVDGHDIDKHKAFENRFPYLIASGALDQRHLRNALWNIFYTFLSDRRFRFRFQAKKELHCLFGEYYHCVFCGQRPGRDQPGHIDAKHKEVENMWAICENRAVDQRVFQGLLYGTDAEDAILTQFQTLRLGHTWAGFGRKQHLHMQE